MHLVKTVASPKSLQSQYRYGHARYALTLGQVLITDIQFQIVLTNSIQINSN